MFRCGSFHLAGRYVMLFSTVAAKKSDRLAQTPYTGNEQANGLLMA